MQMLSSSATKISEIDNIVNYLDYLIEHRNKYYVAVCIRDTAGFYVGQEVAKKFNELGLKTNLLNIHQNSFAAIILEEKITEECKKSAPVYLYYREEQISFELLSKGFLIGDMCSIKVNGKECAVNTRGINIVVVKKTTSTVIDSVAFDTHSSNRTITRKNLYDIGFAGPNDYLIYLEKRLNDIEKEIKHIEINLKNKQTQWENIFWYSMCQPNITLSETKKQWYMKIPPAEGKTREIQLSQLKTFRKFVTICKENNLRYWLTAGSMIGAERTGKFIPWDDDMDIEIPYQDYLILVEKANDYGCEVGGRYHFDNYSPGMVHRFYISGNSDEILLGAIDIFVVDFYDFNSPEEVSSKRSNDRDGFIKSIKTIYPLLKWDRNTERNGSALEKADCEIINKC